MPRLFALLLIAVILLSGCSSPAEQAQAALKNTPAAAGAVGDTGRNAAVATAPATEPAAPQPTEPPAVRAAATEPPATATPQPEPTSAPQALVLGATGFGQDGVQVVYAFEIENPNPDAAVEQTEYQVAAYDADGVALESDSGYISLLLPGEKSGVAGTMYLSDKGQVVSRIEAQIKDGRLTSSEPLPPFTVAKVTYVPDDHFPKVTGVVSSPYKQDTTEVRVNALAYDAGGKIIGGGMTYLNFVPAGGAAPIDLSVTTSGAPAKVVVYAGLSGLSSFGGATSSAPGAENIQLLDKGFGQDGERLGYAFIVENPNAAVAVERSQYQVAAYDKDGAVLESAEGYIELLLPGQKLGVADTMYLPDKSVKVDRVDVQVKPGAFEPAEAAPPVAAERARYIKTDYSTGITGVIKNPYDHTVTNLRVSAVAYDDAGAIIGGGSTFVEFALPGEETGVSTSVVVGATPTKVELYAAVSGLSSLTEPDKEASTRLALEASGFGAKDGRAGYALVVRNTDATAALESSKYMATAYDADGGVLATDSGYITLLMPGETSAAGGVLLPPEGTQVARVVCQVLGGTTKPTESLATFTVEKVAYVPGSWDAKITGQVVNPYAKDVKNLKVVGIAYDAAGKIIGGGTGYLEFVPANGKAAAEASVTTGGKPAKVELYAGVSGLSDLE